MRVKLVRARLSLLARHNHIWFRYHAASIETFPKVSAPLKSPHYASPLLQHAKSIQDDSTVRRAEGRNKNFLPQAPPVADAPRYEKDISCRLPQFDSV